MTEIAPDRRRPASQRSGPPAAAFLALVLAVAAAMPLRAAHAQSNEQLRTLLDRIERLERDIRTLNIQVSRGEPAGAAGGALSAPAGAGADYSLARINVRLNAIEDELRSTTGTIEGLNHQVQTLSQRLDKLVGDVDYRLGVLEKQQGGRGPAAATGEPQVSAAPSPPGVQSQAPASGSGFSPPPGTLGSLSQQKGGAPAAKPAETAAVAAPAKPSGVLPPGSTKDQYSYAFGLLRQANYDQAEVALKEFLKEHPDDPLSGNARYWLGETYYVRAEYLKAAETFVENYKLDANGSKAPDTLLKLGMSLANLDKKQQSCNTFAELKKRFPDASSVIKSTAAKESKRIGCK